MTAPTEPIAATSVAPVAAPQASTALVITDDQLDFTPVQIAALKQLGIEDAPEGDRQVFFHQAKRTGLDPFAKQIYMLGRKTKVGGYRGEPERWETKYTIQTGIDGYRVLGHRTAKLEGLSRPQVSAPQYAGEDGVWRDLWVHPNQPPLAAKVTIVSGEFTQTAVAMYHEYVQTKANGDPNAMWARMPANQLAKCAEAAAWRKLFPQDFSGLVLEDAAHTVIDEDGNVVRDARVSGPAADWRERVGAGGEVKAVDPAPAEQATPSTGMADFPITRPQRNTITKLLQGKGYGAEDWPAILAWLVAVRLIDASDGRKVESTADLTSSEGTNVITALNDPARAIAPNNQDQAEQPAPAEADR